MDSQRTRLINTQPSSVPHGSIFGPLGFTAYIENLTAMCNKHMVHLYMYADDTKLYDSKTLADAECL